MPENKTIHDLPIAEQTNASDVFETEIPSQLMQSGYASRKVTMSSLENHMLGTEQYNTQLSNFPQGSRSVFSALEYARQGGGGGGASVVQKTMAEYEALPSSAKMNGSIYKITDKALIYCLDEEYHAVKEITSADYALLTSDEKNNGTLYVITDEETTAADIPYAQGVSVADKLDSLKIIKTGKSNYSNLKGGGWADRVTVTVTFDTPMPNASYVAFAMINDAYNDFPFIRVYTFQRSTTGFVATCINQSGSQTAVSGQFDWIVIG